MDGLAVAIHLRRQQPHVPLVLLNALHAPIHAPAGLFAASLNKPVKQEALYCTLQKALSDATPQPDIFPKKEVRPMCPASDHPASSPGKSAPPFQVLVVEDNGINQRLIQFLLKQLGYDPDIVSNGLEAIKALDQQPYDLIFMDLHMPVMGGLEATQQIMERWPADKRPRIIALTADVRPDVQQACRDLGMDAFLSKPVKKENIIEALSLIESRKTERPSATEPRFVLNGVLDSTQAHPTRRDPAP